MFEGFEMNNRNILSAVLLASLTMPVSQQVLSQGAGLEEVVVTARKRDESIFEIPVSVAALSQNQLDRAGIENAEELSNFVAGLDFQGSTSTGGRQNPSIRFRGMNQQIITPSTQVGALFWDGSYIAGGGAFLPFADVERVEVIKGPQTAYFGRNTFSGAVNIIPRTAGDEWEATVGLDFSPSQEAEYVAEVGFGGPITDTVGVRLYVGHEKDGGDFNTQDGEPYAVFEDTTFQGTLTIEPSDDLRMKFTGYYVNADDNGTSIGVDSAVVGTPAGQCNIVYRGEYLDVVPNIRIPFTRDLSTLPFSTFCGQMPDGSALQTPLTLRPTVAQSAFGQGGIDLLNNVSPFMTGEDILRSPPGMLGGRHRTQRLQFSGDYDVANHTLSWQASRGETGHVDRRDFWFGVQNIPGTVGITGVDIAIEENYYEARIASSSDRRLRYLVGASTYDQRYRTGFTNNTVDFQDNKTTALFGSIDYDISDALTLSVEARYQEEESLVVLEGNPNLACQDDGGPLVCNLKNDYDDFIPRVILSYEPFEGATLYGSYSYSSLLGVGTQCLSVAQLAPNLIDPADCPAIGFFTAPQENTQYEIGWKQQLDTFRFTVAAFTIDWKNQPFASVVVLPVGTTSFRGPGDSEYLGFDFDFTWAPVDWMELTGYFAYVDTEMTSFSSRGSNESSVLGSGPLSVVNDGNESRNIPPVTATLSPTFLGNASGKDWFIRTDIQYRSKSWADYSELNRNEDQLLVNMRAGITLSERYALEIYGKNLTNNKALGLNGGTTGGAGGNRKAFNEPYQRPEFGVRLTANF
jgi:iron complex outermembrane receptor protein